MYQNTEFETNILIHFIGIENENGKEALMNTFAGPEVVDTGDDTNSASSPGRSAYRWQVVGMLWWVCFFNYADRQAIYSVFPLLARDLQLGPVQLGLLGSAFAWVYAVAGPFTGMLVDRIGRKVAVLAGLEIWSVICAATALSRRFRVLVFFRAAEGLGESIYFPASMSTMAAYHPGPTRSRAFGIHQTSIYAGTVAGGLIAGWLGERYGWRSSFVLFGILGMVLGLILVRFLKEPPRQRLGSAEPAATFQEFCTHLWRTPAALLLILAFGAVNFVAVVQLSWMPSFLYQRFHLSLAWAAFLATALAQSGAVAGSLCGGYFADKVARYRGGRISVQMFGVLLGAPCVYACGTLGSLQAVLISLFLWGFCKGLYDANTFASLFDQLPRSMHGVGTGVMNSSGWLLGGTSAPVVIGVLSLHYGLGRSISFAAAGYLIAFAVLFSARLADRRTSIHI